MKAVKKPIEVDAFHFTNFNQVPRLLFMLNYNKQEPAVFEENSKRIYISKERGMITLELNDWLIYEKNTDECFWVVQEDIFHKTYEHVRDDIFVKKSYEVEFVEFNAEDYRSIIDVLYFIEPHYYMFSDNQMMQITKIWGNKYIEIDTLEGKEKLYSGEILVRGIDGELYPVKKENFYKVYDVVY